VNPDEYLRQLITELASDVGYASGKRPFPRKISPDDASVIMGNLQHDVDEAVTEREQAAAAEGVKIACSRGCNVCCHHTVMIYQPEAVRIARWLSLPQNAHIKEAYLARYPKWREGAGDADERIAELTATFQHDAHVRAHMEQFRRRNMCAFNGVEGECTIYPVRPVACRNAHARDTAEHCAPESPVPMRMYHLVPVDNLMKSVRMLILATHHAMGGPRCRPKALCQAVYDLLQDRPPAP
jgi:Fe-S-cluster containining protein